MACTPKQMAAAIIRNLPLLQQSGVSSKKEAISFLKSEGLGHIQAQTVYSHSFDKTDYDKLSPEGLFTNPENLELYRYLEHKITTLHDDVRVEPCKTYIPFYRKNQFAIVAPAGTEHLKLGLVLPESYSDAELRVAHSFGTERVNRKINLRSKDDVDAIYPVIEVAYLSN